MPCYYPMDAWRNRNAAEKRLILTYNAKTCDSVYPALQVPCGQCAGCRLKKSMEWAARCIHEASLHEENCFITVTYDDAHLPPLGSLRLEDFQKFLKRYRKLVKKETGREFRIYYCGEYGDRLGRPHYHACIFGHDFLDKKHWRSPTLEKLWSLGNSEIGSVTFESAAYVARYIMKKQNGKKAQRHYTVYDPDTGEIKGMKTT